MRKPSAGAVIGAVALVAALGGGAYAAIPGPDGQISACYQKAGLAKGKARVVDHNEACTPQENRVAWSQRGPKGDPGIQGPKGDLGGPGPKGDTGAQGPAGVVGAHSVFTLSGFTSDDVKQGEARCPPGEVATGGGHNVGTDPAKPRPVIAIQQSLSISDANGRPVGWRVIAIEAAATTESWTLVTDAICAPTG
jgi:hypothetical protein